MLAQSVVHESGGRSPTAECLASPLTGSGGKGKKSKGLAGLFSDILSQAQKNLGGKDAKGSHAAKLSSHEAEALRAKSLLKDAVPFSDASPGKHAASGKLVAMGGLHASSKTALSGKLVGSKTGADSLVAEGKEASGTKSASEKDLKHDASEKLVRYHGNRAPSADQAEAQAQVELKSKTADDKRRPKAKGQVDEAAYSLVNLKMLSANASQLKAGEPSTEANSSINVEGGKKGLHSSSKPELTVLDLRRQTDAKKSHSAKEAAGGEAALGETTKVAVREVASASDSSNVQFRELTLDARGTGESGSLTQARSDAEVASGRGQDFQSMLSERLRDQWNGEIVQSAHIVLRDGDAGTIRLRLRPESLGNVKIELNLSDNNISGKIVVESDEAKSAFEKNMNDLADAFRQGGFDSAKLEVAVGSGSGGGAQAQGGRSEGSADPFFSERLRSAISSPADPAMAASAYSRRGSSVDMFA